MPSALLSPRLTFALVSLALILSLIYIAFASAGRMPDPFCPPFC